MSDIADGHAPTAIPRTRARLYREIALSVGAFAGLICVLFALAAVFFGITPLIFRSGSMAPAIDTGALALSKKTPATEIQVGDIVNVTNAAGNGITHRVVEIGAVGTDSAQLILQGDANSDADVETYIVSEAGRVIFSVPKLGYAVTWLTGPVAVFIGGILVGVLLMLAFRPESRREAEPDGVQPEGTPRARHSKSPLTVVLAIAAVSAVGISASSTPTTLAAGTDTATALSGIITAPPLLPPTALKCVNNSGILNLIGKSVTMSWTPPVLGTGLTYRWTITRRTPNGQPDRIVTVSGTSADVSNGLLLGLRTGEWVFRVETVRAGQYSMPSAGFTLNMTETTSLLNLLPGVDCGNALASGVSPRRAPSALPQTTESAPTVTFPLVPESTTAPAPTTTDPSLTEESPVAPPAEVQPDGTTPSTTTPSSTTDTPAVAVPPEEAASAPTLLSAPQSSPSGASAAQVVSIDGAPTLQIVDTAGTAQYSAPASSSEAYGYGVNWSAGDQLWILGPDQLVRLDGTGGSWSRTVVDPTKTDQIPPDILALLK
ncbi:signal peptidase I [Rhodococcus sp. IEGM 1381]|uniref:signal peptidase I n=1 Tax=Rhodococcus sp. IEGM 1381 TaxID=3047085 RepID=UPI0024B81E26|nr:signal peptidase I [Rhodococcus sp. IEGM 1381]MDI9898120.1 signal peptidase I [Rhodococcus sp. IEGM 1381]